MTVLGLLSLRTPGDFADWYRIGGEYVREVADGMEFATDDLAATVEAGEKAMRAGDTDPPEHVARSIAADLIADALFSVPFDTWTPWWYRTTMRLPVAVADRRLLAVARQYATGVEHLPAPSFSTARAVHLHGRPAVAYVDGFADRFAFADAVLHLEWFVHVARESGVAVPPDLVERTRRETISYYAGREDSLSPEVRRFQRLLFADADWCARIDDAYDLDSRLFGLWERVLDRERQALRE